MKNKVISLKQAKRLAELAEDIDLPESEYNWLKIRDGEPRIVKVYKSSSYKYHPETEVCPAYTTGELLEILGDKFEFLWQNTEQEKEKHNGYFAKSNIEDLTDTEICETPAKALGQLLIKLIEEGIYEPK